MSRINTSWKKPWRKGPNPSPRGHQAATCSTADWPQLLELTRCGAKFETKPAQSLHHYPVILWTMPSLRYTCVCLFGPAAGGKHRSTVQARVWFRPGLPHEQDVRLQSVTWAIKVTADCRFILPLIRRDYQTIYTHARIGRV